MIPVTASDAVIGAMLLMCRIGGCFMLMPGLSNAAIPVRIRLDEVPAGVNLSAGMTASVQVRED